MHRCLATVLVVLNGCGLVLDADPTATTPDGGVRRDSGVGIADARVDAIRPDAPTDAMTDGPTTDGGTLPCALGIVDSVVLTNESTQGFIEIATASDEASVFYSGPPIMGETLQQGRMRVDLTTFSPRTFAAVHENSVGFLSVPGVIRVGRVDDTYFAVSPVETNLMQWRASPGTTVSPSPISITRPFAMAAGPSGAVRAVASVDSLEVTVLAPDGTTTDRQSWVVRDRVPSTSPIVDVDVAFQADRGAFIAAVGFEGGTGHVLLHELGPSGASRRAPVDILAGRSEPTPIYTRPGDPRTLWTVGGAAFVAVGYAIGPDVMNRSALSADIAVVRNDGSTNQLLSPLVTGRQILAMTEARGYEGFFFVLRNEGGAPELWTHHLPTGITRSIASFAGSETTFAAAADPTGIGFALVAEKPFLGGDVTLHRIGCM